MPKSSLTSLVGEVVNASVENNGDKDFDPRNVVPDDAVFQADYSSSNGAVGELSKDKKIVSTAKGRMFYLSDYYDNLVNKKLEQTPRHFNRSDVVRIALTLLNNVGDSDFAKLVDLIETLDKETGMPSVYRVPTGSTGST